MTRSNRSRILDLIEQFDPQIRKAFEDAIDDINRAVDLARLVAALERGDIESAIRALNLDTMAYYELEKAIADAYAAGGSATVNSIPVGALSANLVVRFNVRNARAENWLRDHSSRLVTEIVNDQRLAVRSALLAAMQAGQNPRTAALDIVGRVNPRTRRREGGLLGLTTAQERFVAAYAAELASTEPGLLRNALKRARRDKRFDRTILKAIRDGEAIPALTAARMVQRYRDGLLKLRGETIGRTEALASLHAAQYEALLQAVEVGALQESQIQRIWQSAGDARVRDTHQDMDGQTVGLRDQFTAPDGSRLQYPGDPSAPPELVINCRCWAETKVDFLAALAPKAGPLGSLDENAALIGRVAGFARQELTRLTPEQIAVRRRDYDRARRIIAHYRRDRGFSLANTERLFDMVLGYIPGVNDRIPTGERAVINNLRSRRTNLFASIDLQFGVINRAIERAEELVVAQ